MRLSDALGIIHRHSGSSARFQVRLCCGFTPLHLKTFLQAHLQRDMPSRTVEIATGLYGDLSGALSGTGRQTDAVVVALEWPDLDPRLGLRDLGGWGDAELRDIEHSVDGRVAELGSGLRSAAAVCPVVLSGPTLPLPPLTHTASWQASGLELRLRRAVAELAAEAAEANVRVVSAQLLDAVSPAAERRDVKADLAAGFPYSLVHADHLAALLAAVIHPAPPKKGLITDLDDTFWAGILGEAGPAGMSWTLEAHAQIHGLYQQFLAALAEHGVLIGVASKNDPALVEEALQREDLRIPRARLFPVEAHWGAKSESVRRIVQDWNIGADSVVFVDDSPMEVAEVQAAHAKILCLEFPKNDPAAFYRMLERLRDLFGKPATSEEDRLRIESIRRTAGAVPESAAAAPESFLEQAGAVVTLDFEKSYAGGRALELINKTNQFSLNGRRYTEAEWDRKLRREECFQLTVAYRDKFGPLGRIAVISGLRQESKLLVLDWVLSCRAFSRRVEHQCLFQLFRHFQVREIAFDYQPTPRNGPMREFLRSYLGAEPEGEPRLARPDFEALCPPLYHAVEMGALQGAAING